MTTGTRIDRLLSGDGLPDPEGLPRYVAPLPTWLENLGLNLAWLVVATNLVGTAFGFWYYGFRPLPPSGPLIAAQFAVEPLLAWPVVPDSPVATLFIALSLAAWKLGRRNEYLNALAFIGCLKFGLWTPYVLLAFKGEFAYLHPAMYNFLFWSHLAMVVQAFVIHRYAELPVPAVGVGLLWYGGNDVVDYFVPVVGRPHHSLIPAEPWDAEGPIHGAGEVVALGAGPHEVAAAGAVVLTMLATYLALATRASKLERQLADRPT